MDDDDLEERQRGMCSRAGRMPRPDLPGRWAPCSVRACPKQRPQRRQLPKGSESGAVCTGQLTTRGEGLSRLHGPFHWIPAEAPSLQRQRNTNTSAPARRCTMPGHDDRPTKTFRACHETEILIASITPQYYVLSSHCRKEMFWTECSYSLVVLDTPMPKTGAGCKPAISGVQFHIAHQRLGGLDHQQRRASGCFGCPVRRECRISA
jgi:hypothetical protein